MTRHFARVLIPTTVLGTFTIACAHRTAQTASEAPAPAAIVAEAPASTLNSARESATSLEEMLAGRIAGVSVTRAAGGGISVLIRGPTSFYLSTEPLYIVDGVAVQPGPNGALSWLRPEDIGSITVLKDAAAAIYGVRGGNGVVIIRTKGSL
jgi:TonB-dependent SusC/RagA subfamily outer membrane receptor